MTEAARNAAKFLKSTLRLPSSTFPARAPPADLTKYLPRCTDDLYAWQRQARPQSDTFILHDGPPYANGDLHVGHALNKILKDIICRTRLAQGKRIDYVPGWDCHGLPIELKALEKNGWQRGQGQDPVAIRKAARNFASKAVQKQMKGFKEWGIMADWEGHWKTMDKSFELRQLKVFQAMVENGLIYRKHKPVFWSPSSGTALAEAELEYKDDHISTAAYVKFPLEMSADEQALHALIWTTTPWTLPANQAIAVHKDLAYSIVRSASHGRLVIAKERISAVQDAIGEELFHENDVDASRLLESAYNGLPQFRPFSQNRPIIHADFVSADSGTGLVHCAPGHGMEDYLALTGLIPDGRISVRAPVDNAGRFDASATPESPETLAGLDVFTDGNEAVLEMLASEQVLVHTAKYKHKYPIDWRTKEPIIIRATAQWFADLSPIRGDALAALEKVHFVPDSGRSRLRSFVESRTEWCISRQRAWGVPIPAFYHRQTGEAVLTAQTVDHVIEVMGQRGIDAWWADTADEPAWLPEGLSADDYIRGTDTMDVWFDSGTSWKFMSSAPNEHYNQQSKHPTADVYLEGTDQHRGWFQSSLLTHVASQKATNVPAENISAPFRTLLTHGFTLDAHGKKMSKSLGNVISPAEIITGLATTSNSDPVPTKAKKAKREYHPLGPDALRLWVASTDFTRDVTISPIAVKATHSALDKFRVTFKVLLGMLGQDYSPREVVLPYKSLFELDRLALHRLATTMNEVRTAYTSSSYEFHRATQLIQRYVISDLSGVYLESVKDVVYCESVESARRRAALTTLWHILTGLQEMLSPVLPLLVEESWAHCSENVRREAEHPLKKAWMSGAAESHERSLWGDEQCEKDWQIVQAVNSAVKAAQERARAKKMLGQSLASDVVLVMDKGCGELPLPKESWSEILVVSDVEVLYEGSEGAKEEGVVDRHRNRFVNDGGWAEVEEVKDVQTGRKIGVVVVGPAVREKCARCWRYLVEKSDGDAEKQGEGRHRGSVGQRGQEKEKEAEAEMDMPALCGRCHDVVQELQKGDKGVS